MLSEHTKGAIQTFVNLMRGAEFMEWAQEKGPKGIFDVILFTDAENLEADHEIAANREEAEKYLAGLLGMM